MQQVLYLEDEPSHAKLVERYLKSISSEISVTIAEDLESAKIALASEPNLFLVDILVGMERQGLEFVHYIRANGYAQQIIAITALTMPDDLKQCYDSGCTAVICKPFSISELHNVLRRYIQP